MCANFGLGLNLAIYSWLQSNLIILFKTTRMIYMLLLIGNLSKNCYNSQADLERELFMEWTERARSRPTIFATHNLWHLVLKCREGPPLAGNSVSSSELRIIIYRFVLISRFCRAVSGWRVVCVFFLNIHRIWFYFFVWDRVTSVWRAVVTTSFMGF